MKQFILTPFAALFALLFVSAGAAPAQNVYPFRPPTYGAGYQTQLSPYLNLLRPGDTAVNYYGLVLPEQQRRQDRNTMYGSLQGLTNVIPPRPGLVEDIDAPMSSTGHYTMFGNTGSYFGGLGAARGNPFSRQGGSSFQNKPLPAGQAPPKKRF